MNDNELFHQFYSRYGNALLGRARKCAHGVEQDAEDGVQACLKEKCDEILEHLHVHGDQTCPGWLWGYIDWRVTDFRRKRIGWSRSDQVARMIATAPDELAALQDGNCVSSPDVADWEAALTKAFNNCRPPLTETEKAVLRLTFLQEPPLSYTEAAASLDTSSETIEVRRCSGLRKLREFLNLDGKDKDWQKNRRIVYRKLREFLNPDGKGRPADLL